MKTGFGQHILRASMASAAILAFAVPVMAQSTNPTRPISPNAGNLDPFGGNLDPFGGNLDPFAGNVDPFGGNVDPFSGNVDPFGGNVDPFAGNVDPFKDGAPLTLKMLGDFWKGFGSEWKLMSDTMTQLRASPTNTTARNAAASRMLAIVNSSEAFWGQRVSKTTKKSFRDGFANPLLAKYGLSLTDPSSFAKLSAANQARFIFEWYDGLNGFSGVDQVDYWMKAVNWNPTLTLVQGSGRRSTIGIVDGLISKESGLSTTNVGGHNGLASAHGSSVLSLITAKHDGKGIQGIAPEANVVAYNPFDATGTASWTDVRDGIVFLKQNRASIINLSLGEKGYAFSPNWSNLFRDFWVSTNVSNTVYVIAAGNDGVSQTLNVPMEMANDPALLIVGSTNTKGEISSFSNRPGTGCLTFVGMCMAGQRLQDRFLVAPGELLLTSDGQGGVRRVSGTSFSAPLVSGAITLLHDRWPWLVNFPRETANIILATAKDLGAPGTDPIYGRGMLDVEAAQSPINFANLQYYELSGNSTLVSQRTSAFVQTRSLPSSFEANGLYYYLIENLGPTVRDFTVPLAKRLYGQRTKISGSDEYFQDYVARRFDRWIQKSRGNGLTDIGIVNGVTSSGLRLSFAQTPVSRAEVGAGNGIALTRPNVRVASEENRFGVSLGFGQGGRMLGQQAGFGLGSDYESAAGGINPILGFASGGAYVMADAKLSPDLTVSVGYTENDRKISNSIAFNESERNALRQADAKDYEAQGLSVKLDYAPVDELKITFSYARVKENDALFGVQSLASDDFRNGSRTDSATLGLQLNVGSGFSLAASATLGSSLTLGNSTRAITSDGRVLSTSFAFAATKMGIFGKRDLLRLSVMQPLTVRKGDLEFTSIAVIDRETGELGPVTQRFSITDKTRRYTGEFVYAAPILANGELGLFGRMDYLTDPETKDRVDGMVMGGRLTLGF